MIRCSTVFRVSIRWCMYASAANLCISCKSGQCVPPLCLPIMSHLSYTPLQLSPCNIGTTPRYHTFSYDPIGAECEGVWVIA